MYAIVHEGGRLRWQPVPTPEPGPGEVRIAVAASAINRADLLQASGHYPPPPGASPILGLECAGIIDAIGPGVTRWAVGDRCCALLAGGGYAEQVVVPAGQVLPIPAGFSFEQAAALPEVFATAWLNLKVESRLQPGERVILHAGASGVGTAAIQLCALWGNPCFVTVGSREKLDACVALGAAAGAVRHDGPWLAAAQAWAEDGVDVVLDPVGASYLDANLTALRRGGRLCVIGLMGGRNGSLDLGRLLVQRLTIVGSVLRTRTIAEKAAIIAGLQTEVWPALSAGRLRPIIADVIPMTAAESGHQRLFSNEVVGKLILTLHSGVNDA